MSTDEHVPTIVEESGVSLETDDQQTTVTPTESLDWTSFVRFRTVRPTDIPTCFALEKASYPADEAASLTSLHYRQHHAAKYFRCAVLPATTVQEFLLQQQQQAAASMAATTQQQDTPQSVPQTINKASGGDDDEEEDDSETSANVTGSIAKGPRISITSQSTTSSGGLLDNNNNNPNNNNPNNEEEEDDHHDDQDMMIIGFVCSTRCNTFDDEECMTTHLSHGRLLAIHSVVVRKEFRRYGIATRMLQDYVRQQQQQNNAEDDIEKIVLLAKKKHLTFYIHCGFQVIRPSPIVHGSELWYELHHDLSSTSNMGSSDNGTGNRSQEGLPCFVVDAFAYPEQIGSGNPAGVVLLPAAAHVENSQDTDSEQSQPELTRRSSNASSEPVVIENPWSSEWMQTVAAEFNASETAFVTPLPQPEKTEEEDGREEEVHYSIRYFTPTIEVALCGHATLASAAIVLRQIGIEARNCQKPPTQPTIVFHAKEDILRAKLSAPFTSSKSPHSRITMQFPTKPANILTDEEDIDGVRKIMFDAFKLSPDSILTVAYAHGVGDLLVEVTHESFAAIGYDNLNYAALLEWGGYSRGVILCCIPPKKMDSTESSDDFTMFQDVDFVSRFFGPKAGINEDPVTGSAHCVLAPYFAQKLEKTSLRGLQQSKRGGVVECELLPGTEGNDEETVRISGWVVTAVSGTLWL